MPAPRCCRSAWRLQRAERGIARALMKAAIDRVSRRGLRALYLEVAEDNTAAQRLYRALGFAPVGRRPGYYARAETRALDSLTLRRAIVPAEEQYPTLPDRGGPTPTSPYPSPP